MKLFCNIVYLPHLIVRFLLNTGIIQKKINRNKDFQLSCYVCVMSVSLSLGLMIIVPVIFYLCATEFCFEQTFVTYFFGEIRTDWVYGILFVVHCAAIYVQFQHVFILTTIVIMGCGSMSSAFRHSW